MSQLCLVGRRAAISVLSFGNHLVAIVMANRCGRIEITKSTLLLEAIEIGDGNLGDGVELGGVLRALDIEGAAVVGESFGGMLAADLSAHFPAVFSKLVLLAPAGLWRDDEPPGWFEMASGSPEAVPGFLFHDPQCEAAQELFAMPDDPELLPAIIAALTWAQGCSGKFLWPIPDHGLARRLHRVTAPTLVIFGRQDRVMPAVYGEEFAKRIDSSRLEILEECGHIPHVEKAAQTLSLIGDFLQS